MAGPSAKHTGFWKDNANGRIYLYYNGTALTYWTATGETAQSGIARVLTGATFTPPANQRTGYVNLPITSLREVASDLIVNTATSAGGHLSADTTPSLARVNGVTDKALQVSWAANNVDEVQFAPVMYPTDLDDTQAVVLELVVAKDTNTNTTATIAVNYFEGIGDTNAGTSTAALAVSTQATYSVTIAAADVGAAPAVANISLIPSAHANDAIILRAARLRYTRVST